MIALAISGISTALSIKSAKKGSKAQAAANEAQRKANRLRNKQAKRAFLRNFRQAQANAVSSAAARGIALESSGIQGVVSSERSQKITVLEEFKEADILGTEFAAAQSAASKASFKAGAFGQVASFASQFISFKPKTGGESGD